MWEVGEVVGGRHGLWEVGEVVEVDGVCGK